MEQIDFKSSLIPDFGGVQVSVTITSGACPIYLAAVAGNQGFM